MHITYVAQKWGKAQAAVVCPPVLVEEFHHVPRPKHQENPSPAETYLDALLAAAPTSSLAVSVQHRQTAQSPSSSQRITPATVTYPPLDKGIVKVMERPPMLGGELHRSRPSEEQFYFWYMRKSDAEASATCAATAQKNGADWCQEEIAHHREYRIPAVHIRDVHFPQIPGPARNRHCTSTSFG